MDKYGLYSWQKKGFNNFQRIKVMAHSFVKVCESVHWHWTGEFNINTACKVLIACDSIIF